MKTTGVSDIPKFGLLVFLGHPNGDGNGGRPWKLNYIWRRWHLPYYDEHSFLQNLLLSFDVGWHCPVQYSDQVVGGTIANADDLTILFNIWLCSWEKGLVIGQWTMAMWKPLAKASVAQTAFGWSPHIVPSIRTCQQNSQNDTQWKNHKPMFR